MNKKVLIINQFAANKGDRAVLFSLVNELLNHTKDITVSTSQPNLWDGYDFYEDNNINFVPWGWDYSYNNNRFLRFISNRLKKAIFFINKRIFISSFDGFNWLSRLLTNKEFSSALKKADIVISTGGHHITTILVKNSRTSQIFDLSRAIAENKELFLWSQTIGPLDYDDANDMLAVKKIISNVKKIFIRDSNTLPLVNNFVGDFNYSHTYESVLLMSTKFKFTKPSNRVKKVGISIYSTKHRSDEDSAHYIETISSFSNYLIEEGFNIEFFPMEMSGNPADDRVMISSITNKINKKSAYLVHFEDFDTLTHIQKISECQLFIGHKTHSIIFSLAVGTPLIAIAYHVKTLDFMSQYGLNANCISDEELNCKELIEIYDRLQNNIDEIGRIQYETSNEFATKIKQDIQSMINN